MEHIENWFRLEDSVLTVSVRVTPRAKRSRIEGIWNDSHMRIALQAPPVDGQANAAVIAFLAETVGVRKGDVILLSGTTGRCKIIRINCATKEAAEMALNTLKRLVENT